MSDDENEWFWKAVAGLGFKKGLTSEQQALQKLVDVNVSLRDDYFHLRDDKIRLRADLAAVTEERDALLARLAPVDDEALVEIAARAICLNRASHACNCKEDGVCKAPLENLREYNEVWPQARATIAAIRPHIEAAERERCAKAAKEALLKSNYGELHADANYVNELGEAIAAAIRSGK